MDQPIYKPKVSLRRIRPTIWRRIETPADVSLFDSHRTLQARWAGPIVTCISSCIEGPTTARPDREFGMPTVSERRTRLADLLRSPNDRLIYDVRLDRPLGVAAEIEVVDQTLARAGHGIPSGEREERIRAAAGRAINTPRPTRSAPNVHPPQAD